MLSFIHSPKNSTLGVPAIEMNFPQKRWSWAVDLIGTTGTSTSGSRFAAHRASTLGAADERLRPSEDISLATTLFNPNDRQYRCCCGQCHSRTGVRVIAGLLCVTVLLECWQICWHLFFPDEPNADDPSTTRSILSSTVSSGSLAQLLFGLFIVSTIFGALWRESSALLLPYLLMQAVGLGAVFIIFLALFYVVLDHDLETVKSLVENFGLLAWSTAEENGEDNHLIMFIGWLLCLACLCLLALQFWLISIVFACWQYFREKHSFLIGGGHRSSTGSVGLVLLRLPSRAALLAAPAGRDIDDRGRAEQVAPNLEQQGKDGSERRRRTITTEKERHNFRTMSAQY